MAASLFPPLHRTAAVLAFAACLAACDDQASNPQALDPGDIRAFVTTEVAQQLDSDGHFQLAGLAHERYPQISPAKAAEIAVAWARTFGRFHGSYLEGQHGRKIDFHALEVVSPVYYAAGVYEPVLPDASVGAHIAFGPHYLVYLGRPGQPVLSVSVAAFTGAWVEDGELYYPQQSGRDVVGQGVSPATGFGIPPSPEQAVRIATAAGGTRAAAVPELLMPHRDFLAHHARWRITLDRPIRTRLRRTGEIRDARELYVGLRGEISIAAAVQPDASDESAHGAGNMFRMLRRSGRPVIFEPVDASGE